MIFKSRINSGVNFKNSVNIEFTVPIENFISKAKDGQVGDIF
jgi:hypothetical protein